MSIRIKLCALTGALCLASAPAGAGTAYDEAVSGDLANSGLAPTTITLAAGSNLVSGNTGNVGGVDRDYLSFTVPAGMQWVGLTVLQGTTVLGTSSFIGVQSGAQVTAPVGGPATDLLGWTLFAPADIGSDILARIGTGAGAIGFSAPLGAGSYAVWIQETAAGSSHYGFDFVLAAVPEPASYALLGAGLLVLPAWRRLRRS